MKAIKDCKWAVTILFINTKEFLWYAQSKSPGVMAFISKIHYKKKVNSQKNWERFAKLNGITNWKYEN